jgi:hypothetical protein
MEHERPSTADVPRPASSAPRFRSCHLLCAEQLSVRDVTEEVRGLLGDPELLERCLTPALWQEAGVTFVELRSATKVASGACSRT